MAISVDQIKALREQTGVGILDVRKALEDANGDYDLALENLRAKGLATAAKRADREASEGIVELYSHGDGRVGVMVEVNCETDFVARSEEFRNFAHEIALQIAASAPEFIRVEEIPEGTINLKQKLAYEQALEDGKPDNVAEKIAEGRLKKYIQEVVLLEQEYIRDEDLSIEQLLLQTVAALGENVIVRRFARWELGESSAS
ncbi:MAG: translation elongation factor Ts [Chloroflexota bacterium]|nr:MAG: translation elongation factor Ts [Chloroflexota bacterium]